MQLTKDRDESMIGRLVVLSHSTRRIITTLIVFDIFYRKKEGFAILYSLDEKKNSICLPFEMLLNQSSKDIMEAFVHKRYGCYYIRYGNTKISWDFINIENNHMGNWCLRRSGMILFDCDTTIETYEHYKEKFYQKNPFVKGH